MDVINHFHNVGIQYVRYLIHTFCVYVFELCVLVVLFGTWHLIVSKIMTAQGYMLHWLGDVTSTVSFCQISWAVCVTQWIYVHNLHASYRPNGQTTVWSYCIFYCLWYFVHVFLSSFHIQISTPCGISILIPHSIP